MMTSLCGHQILLLPTLITNSLLIYSIHCIKRNKTPTSHCSLIQTVMTSDISNMEFMIIGHSLNAKSDCTTISLRGDTSWDGKNQLPIPSGNTALNDPTTGMDSMPIIREIPDPRLPVEQQDVLRQLDSGISNSVQSHTQVYPPEPHSSRRRPGSIRGKRTSSRNTQYRYTHRLGPIPEYPKEEPTTWI
ncbi:hypothetical protein B0J11DRAFT_38637 [Dendryphion nanum]|uniref:Uncharacterized protein n=1 Tax=Dendryphion nanum TaxID=256645 RepID=A0A9P9ELJ2_9PLEO|nr:hypothetical protein B0J11DRAFT_38637 [Dendryphion nanum]